MGHNEDLYDVIIAGAGPAGLSAAVYMARARYRVLVMEKEKIGGQITITSEIVNYPGVERTSGRELTRSMKEQAEVFVIGGGFAAVEELLALYDKVHRDFAALPPEQQPARLNEITEQYIPWMVNYIYDHFEVFKLLLCCGAQEARDRYFDRLAAVEEQSCRDFIKAMESLGHSAEGMSNTLIHILCRSFFQQLHEFVSHDLPREQAITCAVTLSRFQHAGWVRIMELGE